MGYQLWFLLYMMFSGGLILYWLLDAYIMHELNKYGLRKKNGKRKK